MSLQSFSWFCSLVASVLLAACTDMSKSEMLVSGVLSCPFLSMQRSLFPPPCAPLCSQGCWSQGFCPFYRHHLPHSLCRSPCLPRFPRSAPPSCSLSLREWSLGCCYTPGVYGFMDSGDIGCAHWLSVCIVHAYTLSLFQLLMSCGVINDLSLLSLSRI